MINLLPPDSKRQLRAARRNVSLQRYALFVGAVAILVFATFGFGYYLTTQEHNRLSAEIAASSANTAKYNAVRTSANQFTKDLSTAKVILSNEVVFSDLIIEITKTLPKNVVLSELNLSTETFGTEMSIQARAKNPDDGPISLKSALEKSDLFGNVKIVSIDEKPLDTNSTALLKPMERDYPVTFELLATIDASAGKRKVEGATP